MGGSAVMNTLGDYLPVNVKAAVEEGGYSEIREELVFITDKYTEIPTRPFLPMIDVLVRQFLHFSMNDISTLRQLSQSEIPLLLLHGSDDELVPESMAEDCARACHSESSLVVFPSTGFGGCRYHEDYADTIFDFADKYCNGEEKAEVKKEEKAEEGKATAEPEAEAQKETAE